MYLFNIQSSSFCKKVSFREYSMCSHAGAPSDHRSVQINVVKTRLVEGFNESL